MTGAEIEREEGWRGEVDEAGEDGRREAGRERREGLTLLHDLTLLVDHLGEVSLTHRLGLPIRILEVLTRALEHLAKLHRDCCRGCHLVLRARESAVRTPGRGKERTSRSSFAILAWSTP